jgi:hypothetical protein
VRLDANITSIWIMCVGGMVFWDREMGSGGVWWECPYRDELGTQYAGVKCCRGLGVSDNDQVVIYEGIFKYWTATVS